MRFVLAALVIAVLGFEIARAQTSRTAIYGIGNDSCAAWTREKSVGVMAQQEAWVAGFMSGVATTNSNLRETSVSEILAKTAAICSTNADLFVWQAVGRFVTEISK